METHRRTQRKRRTSAGLLWPVASYEALEARHLLAGFPLGAETLVAPPLQAAEYAQRVTEFTDQAVAVHDDGSFAVAYTSQAEPGVGDEVYVRRFDAERVPAAVNDLLRVTEDGSGDQLNAAVASLPGGGLLVAWYDRGCSLRLDESCSGPFDAMDAIYARRFAADGTPLDGTPLLVNADISGAEASPTVAGMPNGEFVVAWAGRGADGQGGIWLRRFGSDGNPLEVADERIFRGGRYTESPSVEADATGNLALVWSVVDRQFDGQGSEVLGVYASAGVDAPMALSFDEDDALERAWPSLDMDAAGGFVVAYTQAEDTDEENREHDIFVRRFANGGAPIDVAAWRVNSTVAGDQRLGRVAVAGDSSFLVAWASHADADQHAIVAQEFDATGATVGREFVVNTTLAGAQDYPSVDMSPTGAAVVVWSGFGDQVDESAGDQSDPEGVFFQAIDFRAPIGELDVRGGSGSILNGDDEPSIAAGTDFGKAVVEVGRNEREFVIHNVGFGRLWFAGDPSVTIEGGEAGEFSVGELEVDYLDPGESAGFVVSFTPAAVGERSATVTIHTDDVDEGPFQFRVVGIGLAPDHPWRNPHDPFDVNGDGRVNGLDALIIINRLNKQGPHVLPPPTDGKAPPPYYDVSGDNKLTALDALKTINAINARRQTLTGQPAPSTSEMTSPPTFTATRTRRQSQSLSPGRQHAASTDAVFHSWSSALPDEFTARKIARRKLLA